MKAMVLKGFGGIDNLEIEEIPVPQIKPDEVLVQVKAIGIDQIDLKTREGGGMATKLCEEHPMILGWDIAGVVVKTGEQVQELKEGDPVFGTVRFPGCGNAYAEYVAAPASQLAVKPGNLSFEEAAGATQSPLTAWQALMETGHIGPGDKVLIHGAAGGVGNYAVQIAKAAGAYVIGTASAKDRDFVMGLGANECIDYHTQKFEEIVYDVDFILDTIGGENFVRSLKVLKPGGTIVLLPSNRKEEALKVAREQHIEHFYPLLMHSSGANMVEIAGMLADGKMKVYLFKVFPFDRIPEAHKAMAEGGHPGKIVVKVENSGQV